MFGILRPYHHSPPRCSIFPINWQSNFSFFKNSAILLTFPRKARYERRSSLLQFFCASRSLASSFQNRTAFQDLSATFILWNQLMTVLHHCQSCWSSSKHSSPKQKQNSARHTLHSCWDEQDSHNLGNTISLGNKVYTPYVHHYLLEITHYKSMCALCSQSKACFGEEPSSIISPKIKLSTSCASLFRSTKESIWGGTPWANVWTKKAQQRCTYTLGFLHELVRNKEKFFASEFAKLLSYGKAVLILRVQRKS